MGKALTKEDLIYILQAVLMLSQQPDNALHRDTQGLYVKDYAGDLQAHTGDSSIHVTQDILDILSHIGIDDKDELTYDGKQLMTYISKEANNGLSQKTDGLYVPALRISKKADNALGMEEDGLYIKNTDSTDHVTNEDIHVTKEDKDNWNKTLDSAKKYTDDEIGKLPIHDFCFTTQLPTENQDETMLYFLADDPERPLECTFTVYIWRDGKWHTVGVTNKTLKNFVTHEDLTKILTNYAHSNQAVLDAITEDEFGALAYKGQSVFDNLLLSPDPTNAITVKDGKLYVRDYTQEIESIVKGAFLTKVNLYNEEISQSGKYQLKDDISNYNLLIIEYYYKPDKEGEPPGCAKTAVVDVDTLVECRQLGRNYMLEYGYGIMTSNSQIYVEGDMLTVNYYHNVCIYKITGIRKGDEDGSDSE